jgi:hypothetical protein
MTTIDAFRSSTSATTPPANIGPALEALWWLARGNWDEAHKCVQGHEGATDCDSVHAHLHRQEGDLNNANYWYRRAGRTMPEVSLHDEWAALTAEMLARQ